MDFLYVGIAYFMVYFAWAYGMVSMAYKEPHLVNRSGLENNMVAMQMRTMQNLDSLKEIASKNSTKKAFYYNAIRAESRATQIQAYLQATKDSIALLSGGWGDSAKSFVEDDKNLEVPTVYFLNRKHGDALLDSLKNFKQSMVSLVPPSYKDSIRVGIDTDDPPKGKDVEKHSWVEYYWEGVPSIAAITELTKFQDDIYSLVNEVIWANLKTVKK